MMFVTYIFFFLLNYTRSESQTFFFFKDYPAAVFTTYYKNINGLNVFLWKYFYVALLGEGTLKTVSPEILYIR